MPVQAIATLRGISPEALLVELNEAGVTPAERPIAWADPGDLPEIHVDLAALDDALAAVAPSVVPEGCCLVQFQELQPGASTEVAAGDLRLPEHACDQGPYSGKAGVGCFG
jgi:hypothetical protein